MPHYAMCEFNLKYLVNKTLAQKYKRTCFGVLKVLSHNAIKIFVS